MPNPAEVAKLQVEGMAFEDWDTVFVQHRWQDGWPIFRFSCAERAPLVDAWKLMKFKPGDRCSIELGGILAVTGIITQRQTTYDAKNHGVLLSGVGKQWASSTSSVNSENGNFDGQTLTQMAQKVLGAVGGQLRVIGKPDETPFESAQAQKGELVFDFLDRFARMRGASIGTDHLGNTLLIGEHTGTIAQQLTEGENILKMQCVFSNEYMSSLYKLNAQFAVRDELQPLQTNEMQAKVAGSLTSVFRYRELVSEQPVKTISELLLRTNYEAIQAEGTQIRAYVTVQGWLRDGQVLWRTGENVMVNSPMAMLNMIMKIQTATFTQDDRGGTITVLELVLPWMLGDKLYGMNAPGSQAPQPPAPATQSSNESALVPVPA